MTHATMSGTSPEYRTGSAVRNGPVIVAAGGREVAATVRAGALVARRLGREMTILSVIEPLPANIWDDDNAPFGGTLSEERAVALRHDLARAINPGGDEAGWPVEILAGDVPRTIARVAHERQVPLIVMGIGRHRPIDRLLGADTVLRTVRVADCPVLAVAHSFTDAPASAAVGVDFSRSSAYAAQSAAQLVAPGATLHLVHVWQPSNADNKALARDDDLYRRHLPDRFRRFIASLALPATLDVKSEVREGHPAERLVDFVDAHRVDFIAVGRNGRGPVLRLLVGGVTERVLRSAVCSVLIAPDRPLSQFQPALAPNGSTEETVERSAWVTHLDEFVRRNAGRVVALEVNDPEHGVMSQEWGYILFGTSYQEGGRLVLIVLGETNGRRQHGTRFVSDADRISIVRDARGADLALRIQHGSGETVLTILPPTVPASHTCFASSEHFGT